MADKILVAKRTFWAGNTLVRQGARVRAGHEIAEGREAFFDEESSLDFEVDQPEPEPERETAQAPKRGPGRPRKAVKDGV